MPASTWFRDGAKKVLDGTLNLQNDTLRVCLINSTGAAAGKMEFQTDNFFSDINTTWRADGTFYTISTPAGAEAGSHVNYGEGAGVINFTAVATGQKAKGIVVFHSSGTEAASTLVCYCSFTAAANTDGGTVQVTLNGSGFARASI